MKDNQQEKANDVNEFAAFQGEKVSVGSLFAKHYSVGKLMNQNTQEKSNEKKDHAETDEQ